MTALSGRDARLIHDLAKAILTEPRPVHVWPLLMERLTTDLPVDLAVLIDVDWKSGTGHALTGKPDWLHKAPLDSLIDAHMRAHPLLRHYAHTADRTPLALDEMADDRWWKSEAYHAGKTAIGIDRQLVLPLSSRAGQVRGVIMSRGGHGFTDRDLEYAGLARSLLDTVSAHETVTLGIPRLGDPEEYGITSREMAVLALLNEGLTARAIAKKLHIAEKTVIKHKENLYRKLRVHDRVAVLNKSRALGLLPQNHPHGEG
ncbi:helix-turn-helix transcriptional regulator [Amycolatopsis pigmentata]|uniref:Response regulator transcription factor n=1 Tax=Amycolatopsis pigmentata TaxID=450801 RepID=A0ABW5FPC4_9PSEU